MTFGEVKFLEIFAQEVPNSWSDCARVVEAMASSAPIPKSDVLNMIEVERPSKVCQHKRDFYTTALYKYREFLFHVLK